ncbi:hypothetical protein BG015_010531 [Linnemannia schmuckeri]|uniref:F-box domain-containing protein n=1 Tax=Linnemannia schmuckeri TaxID=64567 RepID=A0A9P5V8T4_9FUNG|nr:hypothetical protein BG015_010531 [Linnemannia schmuckeri]
MDAVTSAKPRATLPPIESLSPATVAATTTGLGADMSTSLAKLIQKARHVISEALSSSTTVNTTQEATSPEIADTTTTMAQENEAIKNTDAGMTSSWDQVGPRRSSRVAGYIQAKSTLAPREGSASVAAVPTTAKKRTRAVKGKDEAVDTGNAESQAQAEDESVPRKLRKMTGKASTKAIRKDSGIDLSGVDIVNDSGDGLGIKAESVSTSAPKRRGRPPKNSVTGTSIITTPTPPAKTKSRTTAAKKAKGKGKAVSDPTSLSNLDGKIGASDAEDQDSMRDGDSLMISTAASTHEQGNVEIQGSSSAPLVVAQVISTPPKINPREPFSSLPVEILQHIISWLPLPEIARVSMVSKAWLDAVHYLSVWKIICQEAGLGEPKKKYKTHMALACADSFWICTRCYSYSNAKTHRADLPLPVKDVDDNNHVHMLCLQCRQGYYCKHPEPLKKGVYRQEFDWVPRAGSIAPNGIYINYGLEGNQLDGLETVGSSSQGLPLYDRSEIQKRAMRVHGGWVGVDAEATNPRRKRASACAARAKAAKTCTKRPSTTPYMLERSRIAAEKRAIREEEQERRREEREEELWERRRERAKWHRLEYELRYPERSWERPKSEQRWNQSNIVTMPTIKRIRLVLSDPSANASSSSIGSEFTSAPAPAPGSMPICADATTVAADTSTEFVQLLQGEISLTESLADSTTATSTTSAATSVTTAGALLLPSLSSTLTSSANAVMEALAGLYQPGVNNNNDGLGTSAGSTTHDLTSPAAPSVPSTVTKTRTGTGTGTVPKKRSSKGKERAVDQQNPHQSQGAGLTLIKTKRRRKVPGRDTGSSSSGTQEDVVASTSVGLKKKQGRTRKDPTAPPTPKRNAKGKGQAKDCTDANADATSNEAPSNPTTEKGDKDGGDSEFETDDDMVEIISNRIPQTQKRNIEVLEEANNQDEQDRQEERNEIGAGSSHGEESDHEGYEGHDQIGTQEVAKPSLSNLDVGRSGAVRGHEYTRSIFPTEVLQQILLCLPLSRIARHSRISKAWLDAARVLSVWKEACRKAELGDPRKKYRTHMALVCANSYWICERCMSFSKGREHYADLPLPVEDKEDDHLVWMLCLACRIEYFERHPEPLKEDKVYRDEFAFVVQTKQLAPHAIFINYALRGENLRGIPSLGQQDTRNQLFDRGAIQRRALEVHGGWVGVDACATNPGRKRAAICNERAKECRLYKKKPPTKKRPPVSEEKKEKRREALQQRHEERENARRENRRQKLLWDRVIRLGKRHKWHTTANWRKNRYY